MARNPLSIRRTVNLAGALPGGKGKGNSGFGSASQVLKDFNKELKFVAAKALNEGVTETITQVEAQSRGFKPKHMFPGGRRLATPNLIRAVEIRFDHRPEIVQQAIQVLARGPGIPVDEGHYADNFVVHINGRPSVPELIRFGDTVELVNISDYARMLEVGFGDDGKPFVQQVAPHIVERIMARQMQNNWPGVVKVKFTFTDIPDPYTLSLKSRFHEGRNGRPGFTKKDRRPGMPINYPAVRLEV